jgi:hypothetical protein
MPKTAKLRAWTATDVHKLKGLEEKGQCSKNRTSIKAIVGSYRVQGAHARYTVGCAWMKGRCISGLRGAVTLRHLHVTHGYGVSDGQGTS